MVATYPKSTSRAHPSATPLTTAAKPNAQEIYYPGRVARFMGRVYWVKWCNGTQVCLTARQGLYGGIYQPHPMKSFDLNEWTVPVNHIFLAVV